MKMIKVTIQEGERELYPVPIELAQKYPILLESHFFLQSNIETGEEKFFKIRHDI